MQAIWWGRLLDFLRVQWRKYKSTLYWLLVWLVAGIVLGIVTLIINDVEVSEINYRLIDGNILNATSINAGMGSFIWQRILSLLVPISLVLLLASVSRVTSWVVFPVVLMHGYWLAVAVWWIFFYYGLTAILLLVFYVLWLLVVTAVLLAGLLWALQTGENLRIGGGSDCAQKRDWGALLRGMAIIIGIAVVLGFVEYLVFWTILGKIVYKAR